MNQVYNPWFLGKLLKSYLLDINRLYRLSEDHLEKYQDAAIQKMVRFANTVPVYHEVYKQAGINLKKIRGINDVHLLPFVSKEEIKKYYPKGIISTKKDIHNLIEVSTSGTSGKSLAMYVDFFDIIQGLFGYLRVLREHNINWWKDKITVIGDFAPHTAETGYVQKGIQSNKLLKFVANNIQWLNTNEKPEKIIEEIDRFNPDFIGGYVGMLGHLALLKEEGYGKNIQPQCVISTGAVLDETLKKFINNTFHTSVFEAYGATESGPIAYQCRYGEYHVMSDLVYLEVLKNQQQASFGTPGHVVITKLYGTGTPFIRYISVNDIVSLKKERCSCGLPGTMIERIYGRDDLSLVTTDNRLLLPSSISEIFSKMLYGLKTRNIKDAQIIQHNLYSLEINLVLEGNLQNKRPSAEEIISVLKKGFLEKIGSEVDIQINIVPRIEQKGPRIISKVDRKKQGLQGYA